MNRYEAAAIVGRNIRTARLKRSRSQTALAARTGIPRESISRIENGRHLIRLDQLAVVAKALGVPLATLLDDLVEPAAEAKQVAA